MPATSTVSFGGTVVNGPRPPVGIHSLPLWVMGQTASHKQYAYQLTATRKQEWTLELADLTDAMYALLEAHFFTTAQGPVNTFTYIHTSGTTYANCRYKQTDLQWRRNSTGNWDVTVVIEVPVS